MKRIFYFVFFIHGAVIFSIMMVKSGKKEALKPPIKTIVREVRYTPPPPKKSPSVQKVSSKPASLPKKLPEKKPPPSKPSPKKNPPSKEHTISKDLVDQLQESIAKIEEKGHKEIPMETLITPSKLPKLRIDDVQPMNKEDVGDVSAFAAALVECLQNSLNLPEIGAVKIRLTLQRDGGFIHMEVLESQSQRNQSFLERELQTLKFPPFSGSLTKEKEHTFVITFCNS